MNVFVYYVTHLPQNSTTHSYICSLLITSMTLLEHDGIWNNTYFSHARVLYFPWWQFSLCLLKKQSRIVDATNAAAHQKEQEKIKLLLLGAGESGKSTIFKQMKVSCVPCFNTDCPLYVPPVPVTPPCIDAYVWFLLLASCLDLFSFFYMHLYLNLCLWLCVCVFFFLPAGFSSSFLPFSSVCFLFSLQAWTRVGGREGYYFVVP